MAVLDSEGSTLKHNYVKTNECRPILSAAKMYVNSSSFWQYKPFVVIRRGFLLGRLQTWVGLLKSTNLPFSRCHIFASFRNNVGINCTLRQHAHSGFLPAPIRMTLNDLECPIYLKMRFVDVCLLQVSDSTIRIDVARGEEGKWAGGPSPRFMWAADAPFLCGSWASCRSKWEKSCHRYNRLSGSPGQRLLSGLVGSRVSASDPMFDPVLSFNMRV